MSPYGIKFDEEQNFHKLLKQKYKEDLDYLLNLKKKMGNEEFDNLYGRNYLNEFGRRVQNMDDKYTFNQYEHKNFRKHLMKEYENEIYSNKDRDRQIKQIELDQDKKFIESVNYQQSLENQKRVEKKIKLKSDGLNELDNFYQKKHANELKKYEDILTNQKLIEEQNRKLTERENQYRSKLNQMNDKIYDNAMKYGGYLQNSHPESPPMLKEPFHVKNDHEFNRQVAEIHTNEKENIKRDTSKVVQRLKDLEMLREIESKEKNERMEHQKSYKEYLDVQKVTKEDEKQAEVQYNHITNPLIMPSYHYPNKPIPTSKKAYDPLNWIKNHDGMVNNSSKNCYLGESILRHNPIVQPLDNIDYNKYISKQRQMYSHNNYGNNNNAFKNDSTRTLAKVGNSIIA